MSVDEVLKAYDLKRKKEINKAKKLLKYIEVIWLTKEIV